MMDAVLKFLNWSADIFGEALTCIGLGVILSILLALIALALVWIISL